MKFTESTIEQQAEAAVRARLEGIPFLKSIDVARKAPVDSVSVDFVVTVELPDTHQTLLVEIKNSGQPRIARDAVNQLRVYLERFPGAYGILLAPYVSPATAKICKEAGIGYMDLAGNCRLSFDAVYIDVRGNPNPFSEKRELKSLFAPKAERVLRALLSLPTRVWENGGARQSRGRQHRAGLERSEAADGQGVGGRTTTWFRADSPLCAPGRLGIQLPLPAQQTDQSLFDGFRR